MVIICEVRGWYSVVLMCTLYVWGFILCFMKCEAFAFCEAWGLYVLCEES